MEKGDDQMARKRKSKQTEEPAVTLEELPRDMEGLTSPEELTSEEAEAVQGGAIWTAVSTGVYQGVEVQLLRDTVEVYKQLTK
jgi:hypothetical protein